MGGSGLRLLWKFPGLFETEVTGRRGPFGSCQGVLLSQNRTICRRHCTRLSFRPALPTSSFAGLRAIGRERGPREVRRGARGRGTPRGPGREAGQTPPLSHNSCTFDFCLLPGEEGPQRSAASRRAPDSAAPGGVRPGPEWRELGAAPRTRPGLLHRCVWARSRVFYTPTRTSLCGGAPAALSWGHPQGRTAAPSPPSSEPHRFK